MTNHKIVNTSLPRGNKFIPLGTGKDKLAESLAILLHGPTIKNTQYYVAKISEAKNDSLRATHSFIGWKVHSNDEYPKITMNALNLSQLGDLFTRVTSSKKNEYASRFRTMGREIPVDTYNITIRWDNERQGVWFYDIPYEGKLVNNKPLVVSNSLLSILKEEINSLLVLALVDDSVGKERLSYRLKYMSNHEKSEKLANSIDDLLKGSLPTPQLEELAVITGLYSVKYESGGWILDTSSPGVTTLKLPSNIRTSLTYKYGGYMLPDDYQDWFDEE